ncbi:MAG TPA: phosphate ABC transporter permease PstA, partial [Polyangiaceae bacterium]
WLLAGAYVTMFGFLVVRGGGKIASFTSNATPLSGVEGEEGMRVLLALAVFGGLAASVRAIVHAIWRRSEIVPRTLWIERGIVALVTVLGAALFRDHLPRFLLSLPSETRAGGGIGPEIFNTVYFAVLSTLVTLPLGVGAAIYLAKFARAKRFVAVTRVALGTLASLPSIVYGLFGFLLFVVAMKAGYSLFAGAFVLALLNLPLVVGVAEQSLRAVPRELEDASLALGATEVETVLRVTLPVAWPGIVSALVLSVGRVFAESAPLIMTAGTTISRSNAYSLNPLRGGETLAVHLWYVNSAGLSPDKADVSAGTAAILVVLVVVANWLAARVASAMGARA